MSGLAIDDAAWASRWRDHRLADKAVLCGGLLASALLLPPWPGSVLVAVVSAGLALGPAGSPPRLLLRALRAPFLFIVVGALSVAVTVQGPPSWSVAVTGDSLAAAAQVVGRASAGTLAVLLLALTTPMTDLLAGLRRARVPDACVEVASLVYRLLFILLETTTAVRRSQSARLGYSSARRSLQSAGGLTASVLIHAWDRARRLEQGLAGRGYDGVLPTLATRAPSSPTFLAGSGALVGAIVTLSLVVSTR